MFNKSVHAQAKLNHTFVLMVFARAYAHTHTGTNHLSAFGQTLKNMIEMVTSRHKTGSQSFIS